MTQSSDVQLGWAYPKRKQILSDLYKSDAGKYEIQLKFQGRLSIFKVYAIQIDVPKYRLSNGRTQAAQEEYLAKHPDLEEDFFSRDYESLEAQTVQHQLLREMVDGTPLYSYFKDENNSQDEPLIITIDGFIVNGNRRLCSMREFYYNDKEKYAHFGHIDVAILPVCTPKDIDELEAYLQIQPDIKQNYSWIAKACMLRARQNLHGYSNNDLALLYDIPEKEIQAILGRLTLVDEYLMSTGKPKQYDLVTQNEYAFKQLQKGRQQIKKPDERDLFTSISHCIIDSSEGIEGRLYEKIPEIKEHLPIIVTQLLPEVSITPQLPGNDIDQNIFGENPNDNEIVGLISFVTNPENREFVIENVVDVIESQKEQKKQKTKLNAALKEVVDANTHLQNALNYLSKEVKKQGIEEQLISIEDSIKAIRKWIADNA